MHKLQSLSVFFPCYNEAANVPLFLQEAFDVLPKLAHTYEIIVVDDGSSDGTSEVADSFAKQYPEVRVIHHENNRGYGAALRTGFETAKHEWVFFTDGDQQFRLAELAKLIEYAPRFPVVIGYRRHRADGGIRAMNAGIFKIYIDLLFRLHVKDIDCAFKLLRRDVLRAIHLESTGAFTSSELLYKLKKYGVVWKQVPVNHLLRKFGNSTGNNPKVVIKAGFEALKLYLHMKWLSLFHHL